MANIRSIFFTGFAKVVPRPKLAWPREYYIIENSRKQGVLICAYTGINTTKRRVPFFLAGQ